MHDGLIARAYVFIQSELNELEVNGQTPISPRPRAVVLSQASLLSGLPPFPAQLPRNTRSFPPCLPTAASVNVALFDGQAREG